MAVVRSHQCIAAGLGVFRKLLRCRKVLEIDEDHQSIQIQPVCDVFFPAYAPLQGVPQESLPANTVSLLRHGGMYALGKKEEALSFICLSFDTYLSIQFPYERRRSF